MKVVVFGAGQFGKKYIQECSSNIEIIAVCDNNWNNLKPTYIVQLRNVKR